jgi:hypothetical protein
MSNGVARQFGDRERERLIKLFTVLGSENENEFAMARGRIYSLLRQYDKAWADLIELLGGKPDLIQDDIVGALTDLGSGDPDVLAKARRFLFNLIARHRESWAGLVNELCSISPAAWVSRSAPPSPSPDPERVNPLALIYHLIGEYVDLREHERVAVSLWAIHTHVFRFFPVTPRLALRSPAPDCGKSTLLNILVKLVLQPQKFDSASAAAINFIIDRSHPTLILDEIDNASLTSSSNGRLRAILNSGHSVNGKATIMVQGEPREFSLFCPVAVALPDIVSGLPRTLNSRSITIALQRSALKLKRLDLVRPDPALGVCHQQIRLWVEDLHPLEPDPEMPATVKNRFADNWRPLISIADALGWGDRAREAMLTFANELQDADCKIALLGDIKKVFDVSGADRLASAELLGSLHDLDASDWTEFYGVRGEQQPHRLKAGELASMLRSFGIRPQVHRAGKKTARGYLRKQFEDAWRRYCPETVTPKQASKIKDMLKVDGDTM